MFTHLPILLYLSLLLFSPEKNFKPYQFSFQEDISPVSMIPVQGGKLEIDGQEPATISDFWIGQYEITWEQYEAFVYGKLSSQEYQSANLEKLGIDGLSGATSPYDDMSFGMGKGDFPAVNMTQYAALSFCKWLSALTGDFYRLPTEAEWEYACRKGEVSDAKLADYAAFKKNAGVEYFETGSLKPDKLDLYDMKGNVAEWTMDQYVDDFYSEISGKSDPWTVPEKLYPRTVRGGSWRAPEEDCQCSSRKASSPRWKRRDPQIPKSNWWLTNADFVGFRIVRPKETPSKEEISKYWLEVIEDYN